MSKAILMSLVVALTLGLTTRTFAKTQAAPEAVPGEYIVKIKSAKNAGMSVTALGRILGGVVKSRFDGDSHLFVVKKDKSPNGISAMEELKNNPMVQYAEPNYIYHADKTPNDPDYAKTWGLHNTGGKDSDGRIGVAGIDINVEKAWDVTTGSKDVLVAVIDTGVDYTHPDIKDNLWVNEAEAKGKPGVDDDGNGFIDDVYGYNFADDKGDPKDGHGHGTHVSGTIGARGNDGLGVAGVNWNVRIMAVKFLDDGGSGTLENAVKAIDYATKMGARIESNSWGGGGFSQALKEAIERAAAKNVLFTAAAGNSGEDNDSSDHYPSNYDVENILAVAAIDNQGNLADFSDWGLKTVHVAAPGVNVYSSINNGGYASWSGTSMATPHVTGVAALILSTNKNLTAVDLKTRIMKTSRPLPSLNGKIASGGIIDAYHAVTSN